MTISNANVTFYNKNEKISSIILSSPHSGTFLPREYLSMTNLTTKEVRQSEDSLVDNLLSFEKKFNNILISANWSRGVVDLNRSINDFNKKDFSTPISDIKAFPTKYAKSGLGVIPTRGCYNKRIYKKPIPGDIANSWLLFAWKSFHKQLNAILLKTNKNYGYNILLDFHSMPSKYTSFRNVDIVIGDCFGKSSSQKIVVFIKTFFHKKNLKVNINRPYSGGYITEFYGNPNKNSHAIQIEINRALYLDEKTRNKNSNFFYIKNLIKEFLEELEYNKTNLLI